METTFPVMMESTDRAPRNKIGAPSMVVQQYARYPPALESSLRSASSLGSARSQADLNKSPALHRKETPRSLHSSPRGIRSAIPASAVRSGTSMSPPVFDVLRHPHMKDAADQAESRVLPSREISDENIDDTYVQFIFYCNPNVPSSVDTSELRKTFRSPPRSDGKSFSVFTLFELIRKLDNKELKTWIQLAIELGVEPPSMEKKQSTQKVQQYAVRLKRWMRAMHVDAFFEYCLGHPHAYYTQLPPSGPFVSESRDGVPLEEDLALRALVPQWKPKRGRKRADEREIDEERAAKRPSLDTSVGGLQPAGFHSHSVTFPQSAIPFSAFPEDDPWITASGFPAAGQSDQQGQDLRWRLPDRETSPTGYPQSAILPRGHHADIIMSAEPRSAVTPSSGDKARAKRKHGPAVSSAWPTSNNSSNGKSRGRPPNKPSSGSFSTFQVNSRESSQVPAQSTPQPQPQSLGVDHNHTPHIMPASSYNQTTPVAQGRPGKLQLQVPQHMGAPVRLATPPTLLVNGVNGTSMPHSSERHIPQNPDLLRHPTPNTHQPGILGPQGPPADAGPPKISFDDIIRVLTNELLAARVMRPNPLSPDEAHGLAAMMVFNLSSQYAKLPMEQHPYLLAFHLGVGHHFGLAAPRPVPMTVHIDHFNLSAPDRAQHPKEPRYSISFDYNPTGNFSMQIVVGNFNPNVAFPGPPQHGPPPPEPQRKAHENDEMTNLDIEDDDTEHPASEATWKQRFMKLRAQMQKKDRALSQYKRKIVESVMADI
ncbi:hypothetical protein N7493_005424 [Penicillium malachiteum]|uniref:ARS binding protein Abp2 n=1 Tax=Penicillium malachiteum TaxID=1324776 RepID=A0AAD6MWJ3_9EURO|nr:hypothetical protein N7493_005424 [Penicillium malachiteum]